MKRNACLTLTLVELLCGVGLVFTIGAQTASSEKHAFMPVTRPRLRNQRLLLRTLDKCIGDNALVDG
jgi:hypothetical protein